MSNDKVDDWKILGEKGEEKEICVPCLGEKNGFGSSKVNIATVSVMLKQS